MRALFPVGLECTPQKSYKIYFLMHIIYALVSVSSLPTNINEVSGKQDDNKIVCLESSATKISYCLRHLI